LPSAPGPVIVTVTVQDVLGKMALDQDVVVELGQP